jgi:hypothetical protein
MCKLNKVASTGAFKIKQASPEILAGLGIAFGIGAMVWACKQTYLKAHDVVEEHNWNLDQIKQAKELREDPNSAVEYSDEEIQRDMITTYVQTAKSFGSIYLGPIALGTLSVVCLVGGQLILKERTVALAAAYSVVQKAFGNYRGRVVEELGKEKDFHFMQGTKYETVTEEVITEDGKKKKIKKEIQVLPDGFKPSMYARMFEKQVFDPDGGYTGSSQWSSVPEYAALTLIHKIQWANQQLQAHGYLFLNDVYEELGFPRTQAGQVVGWRWNGDGDNVVSFGPEVAALLDKTADFSVYREGASFLCDFNVDGVILDHLS